MPRYFCSLPNVKSAGRIPELISDDPVAIAAFVKKWDIPGRGVYECVSTLKPGATRRSLETVDELPQIHHDVDLRSLATPGGQVLNKLQNLPLPLELRDSGGGYHVVARLREPVRAGTPEFDQVNRLRKELTRLLCGDPAPDHAAALLRVVGSHNSKYGEPRLCQVIRPGEPIDITEIEELIDLLADHPLFEPLPKAATNGHDKTKGEVQSAVAGNRPIDVDARLANMKFHGAGDSAIHLTQLSVTASLLRAGVSLLEATRTVLEATRAAVANDPEWDWRREELKILRMGSDFIVKHPELIILLPDKWRAPFEEALTQGRRADIGFNCSGFYVRSWKAKPAKAANDDNNDQSDEQPKTDTNQANNKSSAAARVVLKPFMPIDPKSLPCRQWLYGKHYQRRVVSATIAPGGTGKTSLVMVEAVALATCRNLLGEQPEERCRVWLHNGEDSREELNRRVVAICQHYKIPQEELQDWLFLTSGSEMALKVANGYAELKVDSTLVAEMTRVVAENAIDVVMFDPLVTLHSVNESDNGRMDTVIRIFAKLADACDCSVDISHHTRKLPAAAASFDHTVDDTRGASSVRDAVRALRILNVMSQTDAENLGFDDFERLSYLRVDRGKANAVAPARTAIWRKFESIELANGDDVGVITPWQMPTKDPEKQTQDDRLFLQLLDQFTIEGRTANNVRHVNYAPKLFAKEPAARIAKVSAQRLEQAMHRLFASGQIETEKFGRADRLSTRIVRVQKGTQK